MLAEKLQRIGRVAGQRPVQGDIRVRLSGISGDMFSGKFLFLDIDGLIVPFSLQSASARGDSLYVSFKEDPGDHSLISDCDVYALEKDLLPPDEEHIMNDPKFLKGYELVDMSTGPLGYIDSVDDRTANCILSLKGKNDLFIPMAAELVDHIDCGKRILYMHLPEGITLLNEK